MTTLFAVLLQATGSEPTPPSGEDLAATAIEPSEIALLTVLAILILVTLWYLWPRKSPSVATATPSKADSSDPLGRLRGGLSKSRRSFAQRLKSLFQRTLSEEVIEELEEILLSADIGAATAEKLVERLREAYRAKQLESEEQVLAFLKADLVSRLDGAGPAGPAGEAPDPLSRLAKSDTPPTVILVAGVNGTGKTTSIAKLAYHIKRSGKTALLAASDTFRAAAVEQLTIWAERLDVEIVKNTTESADPAAVAFDAMQAAIARGVDYLIVDTAGRLHTQANLMKELAKIKRVLQKQIPDAPHEILLVLDATTGQNGIAQAREFLSIIDVSGIFLTKLDGTARGGIVVAIREQLGIPVKFVGLGEQPEDIEAFDATRFVEALFSP